MKKSIKGSELTFKDIAEYLGYEKVTWNGKVAWEDTQDGTAVEKLYEFMKNYNDKIVYEMYIKVVKFHHTILDVKGE